MRDRCTPNASGCHGPLRNGRPHLRAAQAQDGLHPYRKEHRPAAHLRLLHLAKSTAGNRNGHTSTLPKGLNGTTHEGSDTASGVQDLLIKVANGAADVEAAVKNGHELQPATQRVSKLADDASWGAGASQTEIVWAPGKASAEVAISLQRRVQDAGTAMAARVTPEVAEAVTTLLPHAKYHAAARALTVATPGTQKLERLPGTIAIVTDVPGEDAVVEEARLAASALGCYAYKLGGGSAGSGLSSLLPNLPAVQSAAVVIVIAREDVALPAVIAGLVQSPVIAVPPAAKDGAVASAPGVTVVDRDNGVAAAMYAARILRAAVRLRGPPSGP